MSIQVKHGGETLHLTGDHAVWMPEHRALLVADVHLGKAEAFRANGLAIPAGSTEHDLLSLSRMIRKFNATSLYILGDMIHAAPSARLQMRIAEWLNELSPVRIVLVSGNHDRHLREIPANWRLECTASGQIGSLSLRHEVNLDNNQATVAGHIHPTVRLRDGRRDAMRLPVFWQHGPVLILPSFGSFTGGFDITPDAEDRVFVSKDNSVFEFSGELLR